MWSLGEEIWVGGECFFGAVQACFFGVQRQNMDILSLYIYIYTWDLERPLFFGRFKQIRSFYLAVILHMKKLVVYVFICFYTVCIRPVYGRGSKNIRSFQQNTVVVRTIYGRFQKYTVVYDRIRFHKSTA